MKEKNPSAFVREHRAPTAAELQDLKDRGLLETRPTNTLADAYRELQRQNEAGLAQAAEVLREQPSKSDKIAKIRKKLSKSKVRIKELELQVAKQNLIEQGLRNRLALAELVINKTRDAVNNATDSFLDGDAIGQLLDGYVYDSTTLEEYVLRRIDDHDAELARYTQPVIHKVSGSLSSTGYAEWSCSACKWSMITPPTFLKEEVQARHTEDLMSQPSSERALTPYDTGARLEPKPWVKDGMRASEYRMPAIDDDYGKIDLDDDSGDTVATIWGEIDATDRLTIFVTNTSPAAAVVVEVEMER